MLKSFKWPLVILLVLTLIGLAPAISASLSAGIAKALGCAIEGSAHACVIFGHDVEGALAAMRDTDWLQPLTSPVAAIALVGWIVLLMAGLFRMSKR